MFGGNQYPKGFLVRGTNITGNTYHWFKKFSARALCKAVKWAYAKWAYAAGDRESNSSLTLLRGACLYTRCSKLKN